MNWGTIGENAANGAAGQVMSLLFGGLQDRRQLKQQGKLMKQQIEGQKEMANYNYGLAKQMWEDTNLEAQTKQARKAGMSLSALYGGSGAGGATTSAGAGGSVTGGQADGGNAGVGMGLQASAQLALMNAQKENIEADTQNKKAEAENKATGTEGLKVDVDTKKKTQQETIEKIIGDARQSMEQATIKARENKIGGETVNHVIKQIQETTLQKIIETKTMSIEQREKAAEATIQEFKAEASKNGIDTNAPWYIKLMSSLFDKIDIMNKMEGGGK